MRPSVLDLVKLASEKLKGWGSETLPLYEFGSAQVEGGGGAAFDLRQFFEGQPYIGTDLNAGPGVDLVADSRTIPNSAAGRILCMEVMEHCREPWRLVFDLSRILTYGGWALISVPFNFAIHSQPDYWRFTPEGLRELLHSAFPYENQFIFNSLPEVDPSTVCALVWHGDAPAQLKAFQDSVIPWKIRHAMTLAPQQGDRVVHCGHTDQPICWGRMAEPARILAGGFEIVTQWVGLCGPCATKSNGNFTTSMIAAHTVYDEKAWTTR